MSQPRTWAFQGALVNPSPVRASRKSVPPEGRSQFSACPVAGASEAPATRRVPWCRKAPMVGAETQEKENIMSKPAHKIGNGGLQVTIWRNHGEKGNWNSVNR